MLPVDQRSPVGVKLPARGLTDVARHEIAVACVCLGVEKGVGTVYGKINYDILTGLGIADSF